MAPHAVAFPMADEAAVTVEARDGVTRVRMDDGKVNALSRAFLGALADAVEDAVGQDRPIVLAGNDRIFSAGLDLNEVPTLDEDGLRDLIGTFGRVLDPILRAPVPVVAALTGHAIAGGAILALACDHRVAASTAEIGATELAIGIPFPPTDITLFTARLPTRTIRRTILDPRRVGGEEARALGWVDEVADDPVEAAAALAGRSGGTNREGFRILKEELNRPILEAWDAFEDEEGHVEAYVELLTSKGTQQAVLEGIQRVMEKRQG